MSTKVHCDHCERNLTDDRQIECVLYIGGAKEGQADTNWRDDYDLCGKCYKEAIRLIKEALEHAGR